MLPTVYDGFWIALFLLQLAQAKDCAEAQEQEISGLVVGGVPAKRCRYPYMVSLQHPKVGAHVCGGSLVDQSWVLTAASCVDETFSSLGVANPIAFINGLERGNETDFCETIETVPPPMIHEKYEGNRTGGYNVALVKLASPSDQIAVKLLKSGEPPKLEEMLQIVGWGVTAAGTAFATSLQEVDVQVNDQEMCKEIIDVEVNEKVFCYGDGTQGPCAGDQGGPVVKDGSDATEDVQIGIQIAVDDCGVFGIPSLFTGVSHLIDWIESITNSSLG